MYLWNKNYFIQNIKKARASLLLTFGFALLLNFLVVQMNLLETLSLGPILINLDILSSFQIIAQFIVPVLLSLILFSFVYKKETIDFTLSLPLKKRTIFVTNTIGGLILIIIYQLLNTFLVWLLTTFFIPGITVGSMFFDYFLIFTISYFFVFTISNLAICLTGNKITTVIVILLLLLFMPFMKDITSCYENRHLTLTFPVEEQAKEHFIGNPYSDFIWGKDTSIPYNTLVTGLTNNNQSSMSTLNYYQVIKTFVLSIVYIVLGVFFFNHKKFENYQTSFQNRHVHLLIKCLTVIPIGLLLGITMNFSGGHILEWYFLLALITIYYVLYDYITKKKVKNFALSSIYFAGCLLVILGYNLFFKTPRTIEYDYSQVKSIGMDWASNYYRDAKDPIEIESESLKKKIYDLVTKEPVGKEQGLSFVFTMNDGRIVHTVISLSSEKFQEIVSEIILDKSHMDYITNGFNGNHYAISYSSDLWTKDSRKDIYDLILKEKNNLVPSDYLNGKDDFITLYSYHDLQIESFLVPFKANSPLMRALVNYYNNETKMEFLTKKYENDSNLSLQYDTINKGSNEPKNIFILESHTLEVIDFLNKQDIKIDMSKPIIRLDFKVTGEAKDYFFFLNEEKVVELIQKLSK